MDTRSALLTHATELVRTRGYSGFSYADLAERVGIRKASIHHHFPQKADLGLALIERYRNQFEEELRQLAATPGSAIHRLRGYSGLYRASLAQEWGCLCGMFAAEIALVPDELGASVRGFLTDHRRWLSEQIAAGQQRGELRPGASEVMAHTFLSLCQGALLVSRPESDLAAFDQSIDELLRLFASSGGS